MTLRQYWPPNFSVCRPRVQLTASSNCQTLSSKLVVLSWVPRFDRAELEKLRPSSPSRPDGLPLPMPIVLPNRSEEHTSELQSRLHLVCRLLLENKKLVCK